jgi:hypothetical protein
MRFGERIGPTRAAIAMIVAGVAGLWIALILPAPPNARAGQHWEICHTQRTCVPVDVSALPLGDPVTTLRTTFLASAPGQSSGPVVVHITAMASAEARWNGTTIGRNGIVGADQATETPGRFDAVILVPPDRIRPGPNLVEIRLSAHHLWASVRRPIHLLSVGPYEDSARSVFDHYLPTLVVIGLLIVAFGMNALLWFLDRGAVQAIFAVLSAAILLQAVLEASKLVMTYAYPWQLARLFAIALVATLVGLLIALAALAFVEGRRGRLRLLALLLVSFAVVWAIVPWWDAKALWAFRIGLVTALCASAIGLARGMRYSAWAGFASVLGMALSGVPAFLDIYYYLFFVALFGGWTFLWVRQLWPARVAAPADLPATANGDILFVPDGGSQHRLFTSEILYVRAADDYCIVCLSDGREVLATLNLAAFLRRAPGLFLRVHRSHAVNSGKIAAVHRTGKFARTVELVGGLHLPVGRTYWTEMTSHLQMDSSGDLPGLVRLNG